jgi:hypothetical protein
MRQLFLAQRVQTNARYTIVQLERAPALTAFIDGRSSKVNRKILSLVAAFFLMILPVAVIAQSATGSAVGITSSAATTPNATTTPNIAVPSAGPTNAASTAGIRAPVTQRSNATAAAADSHLGAGQNVALMVVGGAALIIGAAIGETAGVLLAIGGAIVFLYGLYNFIQ